MIVLDIEIERTIDSLPGGWNDTDLMNVACAVVYDVENDIYEFYQKSSTNELKDRIIKSDYIITYNGWNFDFPVIWGLPNRTNVGFLRNKSIDLLRNIWVAAGLSPDKFTKEHKGFGLDLVCRYTIGRSKIENGANAPMFWAEGRFDLVWGYCLNDVRITYLLYEYIRKYGYVINPNTNRRILVKL